MESLYLSFTPKFYRDSEQIPFLSPASGAKVFTLTRASVLTTIPKNKPRGLKKPPAPILTGGTAPGPPDSVLNSASDSGYIGNNNLTMPFLRN